MVKINPGANGRAAELGGALADPTAAGAPPLPLPPVTPLPPGQGPVGWLDGLLGANAAQQQVPLTTTGPTVQIDINAVQDVIKGYREVYDRLNSAKAVAQPLRMIRNPGDDDASHNFKDLANSVGDSHQQALLTLAQAVQEHIDKLQSVIQQYQATEHGNAANLKNQGH